MGNAKISIILLSHHLSKSIRGCAHLSIEEHGIYGTGVPGRSVNAHLMFTFSVSTPFTPPGKIGWLSIQRSDSTKNHMSSYKHMYGLNYGGDSGYEVLINGSGGQCQISIILLYPHLSKSIRGCAHLSREEHGIYRTGVPGRSGNAHLMVTFSVSTPFTPPGKIGWLSIQNFQK